MDHHFTIGDRVRTIAALDHVAPDRMGTVVRVYPATPGFYGALLDGQTWKCIVTGDRIAIVSPPQDEEG